MNAEKIAEQARRSISRFCVEDCMAYCCRKGYLVMSSKESDIVTAGMTKYFDKQILKQLANGKWSLFLGNPDLPCPSLKEGMCVIHKNPERPLACRQFPLFLEGNTIKLSPRCLAVKQGVFYPYIKKLMVLGYKLAKNSEFSELADGNALLVV